VKQTGERRAGKPHAAFEVAGAGNVAWSRCCDTRRRKSEITGKTNFDLHQRASLRPYRANLASDAKGKGASGCNREAESTDAPERGGLPRSSEEAAVMVVERRGWVIVADVGQLVRREEPFVQWKAAAFARWHEPDEARVSSPESVSGSG
jgi:hypothetical protein